MTPPTLLAPAHYTNWMPFEARETASGFSISCRKTPRGDIALHAGIIAAGFGAFGWLTYTRAHDWFWATLVLGALTLGGFLTSVICYQRSQQRRGPILVYDKASATIDLPREGRTFTLDEVDCICLVNGHAAGDPVCQLQLHSRPGGCLLLATGFFGALDDLFKAITSSVPVPARRYDAGKNSDLPSQPQPTS